MTNKQIHILSIILCSSMALAIGGVAGYLISTNVNALSQEEQKLIDEYRLLKDDWLYGNETEYLNDLAMQGMATGIAESASDSFTFYTSTAEGQGLATDGKGFGYTSHYYDGGLYVVSVFADSTAYKAGLKPKDVIYSVRVGTEDTFDFKTHTYSEINAKLSSVQDTSTAFQYTVRRGNEDITISMTRGSYSQDLVTPLVYPSDDNNNLMAIRVNTFLGQPALALKGTLQNYKDKIDTLVIDLRGNGGGYVTQASEMAKLFVKKGTLLYDLRDKDNQTVEDGIAYQDNDPEFNIPNYKIIMDSNTASASEIFTLAMRAGANATTYGLKSHGKGIAQNFMTFSDNSVIRYTYAYVYGPEKENETMYDEGKDSDSIMCIHGKGIIPDVSYSVDYDFLGTPTDYSSLGISVTGQNFFLKVLNDIYPNTYPTGYSSVYHFTDAVKAYGTAMAVKYDDASLAVSFNDNGGMLKALNDVFNKEEYDKYLYYYDDVTSSVTGGNHD